MYFITIGNVSSYVAWNFNGQDMLQLPYRPPTQAHPKINKKILFLFYFIFIFLYIVFTVFTVYGLKSPGGDNSKRSRSDCIVTVLWVLLLITIISKF